MLSSGDSSLLFSDLILSGSPDTLPVELDNPEGDVAFVEHDDFVVVATVVHNVPQS